MEFNMIIDHIILNFYSYNQNIDNECVNLNKLVDVEFQATNKSVSRLLDPTESMPQSSQSSGGSVQPIKSLNPYMNRWTIKARVASKSDIRTWSNAKGEGSLFSMDLVSSLKTSKVVDWAQDCVMSVHKEALRIDDYFWTTPLRYCGPGESIFCLLLMRCPLFQMDESGEIRCTGFKEQCEKFYKMLEVGKVYLISNCTLKPANKQYSKLDNDYEMTMKESTEVFLCTDDDAAEVPSIVFNFVKISDLNAELKDKLVDLIAVCKSASDVQTITSQKLNKVQYCDQRFLNLLLFWVYLPALNEAICTNRLLLPVLVCSLAIIIDQYYFCFLRKR